MDEGTFHTLLALGVFVSIVLTIRAIIDRSWLTMWIAPLGLFPLILTTFGIFAIPSVALQLAAAGALRQKVSGRGWVAFIGMSLLIWTAVLISARFWPLLWIGTLPLLPLSLLTLLLPLLPIGLPRFRSA